MALKRLLPKQPIELTGDADPKPGNDGQLAATLDSGIEMLSKNRGSATDLFKAARSVKN